MEARFNLKVDAVVLPGRTELNGTTYAAGDLLCTDGKRTWVMPVSEADERLKPCSESGKRLLEQARDLAGARSTVHDSDET